jgi:cell division protein FtsQ
MAISPKIVLGGTALVLIGALIVAGATGHRAERLAAATGDAIGQAVADAGLRLQTVRLDGASPEASADILRAASLERGVPLLGVDLAAARRRVEQVGWVKSAKVVRLFPDTVAIEVDERRLMAVWQHDGHASVVDVAGVVAPEADPARFTNLPLVVGEGANVAAAQILPLVAAHGRLAQRLDALVRVDDRRWDLRLKDGGIVQLPATDEEAALIRLDQLDQQSRILDLGFARIDLRDPEMVAVRPRPAPAAGVVSDGAG